jgi:hypothetical protein
MHLGHEIRDCRSLRETMQWSFARKYHPADGTDFATPPMGISYRAWTCRWYKSSRFDNTLGDPLVAYEEVLASCDDRNVGAAVLAAVEELFEKDRKLLLRDAHERTIAAKLAEYLRPQFPDYDVNFEYNRMGDAPKRLAWRPTRNDPDLVYPDLIVHTVGDRNNILVIELKLDSNDTPKDDDLLKLKAFRSDPNFHYRHALFIRFGVGEKGAGTLSECQWVHP